METSPGGLSYEVAQMLRCWQSPDVRHGERGVTIVFVALAMVAILAIAALSIDVIVLYLAKEEAQRSADAAALAAARVLSLSGVTGDPQYNDVSSWQEACNQARLVAQAMVNQNTIGRGLANVVTVTFLYNGAATDCTGGAAFAVNPQVKVDVTRQALPNYFSRIWNRTGNSASATATAEAFNPSNSGSIAPNGIITVSPKCVKPWIVPNQDPSNPANKFVGLLDGSIQNKGIQLDGSGIGGVIGETFTLVSDCRTGNPNCSGGLTDNPPTANSATHTLDYVPALVAGTAGAVPSCAVATDYQQATGGCDQSTVYACGVVGGGVQADLTFDPGKPNGETSTATQCLIHQPGQDWLDSASSARLLLERMRAGPNNPAVTSGTSITSSNSIVSLPIYDTPGQLLGSNPPVTIVGFLQVFINNVDSNGNVNVTVLNVAGCSNTATTSTPTVSGTSPVPVRLITPQ